LAIVVIINTVVVIDDGPSGNRAGKRGAMSIGGSPSLCGVRIID
jgi:hypothetical protein